LLKFIYDLEPFVANVRFICAFRQKLVPISVDGAAIDANAFERFRQTLKTSILRLVEALRMNFLVEPSLFAFNYFLGDNMRNGVSEAHVEKFSHAVGQIIHVKVSESNDPDTGKLIYPYSL
jgi:hypothetical protein